MSLILNIETSTAVCSVALSRDGKLLSLKEDTAGMKHASHLTLFIEEILQENNLKVSDLDAVAISMGPGSYTGLRIGVSTAKGICYGAGIPLIAVSTLQSLTKLVLQKNEYLQQVKNLETAYFCPMIDARRMEVYTAFYDNKAQQQREISADIIDENSFADALKNREIVFFGDGAEKCKSVLESNFGIFIDDVQASALGMIELSYEKFKHQQFEDVAYFEPFYLKDFVATTPQKKIF